MKKKKVIIIFLLIASILITTEFFPTDERKVYTELIRLHILANSGNEEDVALKYLVRDEVLKESESIFAHCSTSAEAKESREEPICLDSSLVLKGLSPGIISR